MADVTRIVEVRVVSTGDAEAQRTVRALASMETAYLRNEAAAKRLETASNRTNSTFAVAGRSSAQFEFGLRNLGYQIGDVATQMAAGTSATRAFAVQSGQAIGAVQTMFNASSRLGAFLSGPWGIAIATAASVLIPLGLRFRESSDSADAFTKALRGMKTDAGNAAAALQRLQALQKSTVEGDILLNQIELAKRRDELAKVQSKLDGTYSYAGDANMRFRDANDLRSRLQRSEYEAQAQRLRWDVVTLEGAIARGEATQKKLDQKAAESEAKMNRATAGSSAGGSSVKAAERDLSTLQKVTSEVEKSLKQMADLRDARDQLVALFNAGEIGAINFSLALAAIEKQMGIFREIKEIPIAAIDGAEAIKVDLPQLYGKVIAAENELAKALERRRNIQQQVGEGLAESINLAAGSIASAIEGTQKWSEAWEQAGRQIVRVLAEIAVKVAILELAMAAFGRGSKIAGFISGAFGFANGGVIEGGVQKFANGGVIAAPTMFPMARGVGLMGEAGPEAIMPLRRGANGKLGVEGRAPNVIINNYSNASVEATQTDTGDIEVKILERTSRAIAADIRRGDGPVASAIQGTYRLGRNRR